MRIDGWQKERKRRHWEKVAMIRGKTAGRRGAILQLSKSQGHGGFEK